MKFKFFYCLVFLFVANAAIGQMLNRKFTLKAMEGLQGNLTPANALYNFDNEYSGKTILLLTPSFPINFNRIERDLGDNWRIGPNAAIGGAYYFLVGKGYRNENETIQVEPYIVFGLGLDGGISQNLDNPGVVSNLNLSGMIGFYKYLNVLFAYDLLNKKAIYGIGARIDLFSLTQGYGTLILNKKDFFGAD